jgi:NTP pyrophosphatase (non-canonical NTP hydrolase)
MQLDNYQEIAKETDLILPIDYYFLGLVEEAGEVAGIRKRVLRNEGDVNISKIKKELGDVLWYLTMIADKYNISLDDIAIINLDKLNNRKHRGIIKGSGSNR